MMHTWKLLGLNALLAAALTATPAVADPADSKKLDEIKDELKGLSSIKEDLKNLRALLDLSVQNTRSDISQLKEQVGRLEKQVKDLEGRMSTSSGRVAFSPSTGAATGRIRLMNTFTEPMSIRLNERVFRLEPGQTQMLDNQPVGAFTFEVLGIQGPAVRVLGANETFTVYVYPR